MTDVNVDLFVSKGISFEIIHVNLSSIKKKSKGETVI